jgi:23S rRNA (guanosine2251-2'-O)-methyltransferase
MDKEQTLIFGIRSVKEAIDSNKSLNRVYIQRGLKGVSAFDLIKTLHKKILKFHMYQSKS